MGSNMAKTGKITRGPSKKRITDLVTLARRLGIKHLRAGEVEFELAPMSQIPKTIDNPKDPKQTETEREPTEDEMLLYSTASYDQMRADRADPK
jgi:hypothetical protein